MNARQKIEKAALAASVLMAASGAALLGAWAQTRGEKQVALRSTIAFVSTRHDPVADAAADLQRFYNATEIYLMGTYSTAVDHWRTLLCVLNQSVASGEIVSGQLCLKLNTN